MINNNKINILKLKVKCKELRNLVLDLCHRKGGHVSTSFSCVELLVGIYYSGYIKFNPKKINDKKRDIFVLSKGHGAEMLYVVLADLDFFPKIWLKNNYRDGTCILGGHVNSKVPGVELSTGSLGHGLSYIGSTALADKIDGINNKHVVLLGDAECTAGSLWEAASFISYNNLFNVTAIVDLNKIGNFDFVHKFMDWEKLHSRWKSCGWHVIEIRDGNNIKSVIRALNKSDKIKNKPKVLIVHTVKGKGVKVFENDPIWATRPVSKDVYLQAKKELI